MRLLILVLLFAMAGLPARANPPVVKVAVLKFGTVNWLMDTIQTNGLDAAEGYTLSVVHLAGKPATAIALQSGEADIIVTDWVWAMRQQQAGVPYRFLPYSRALGALMVSPASGIKDLCELKGARIGVAGGPIDKSWLVFQALARQKCGFDLTESSQALYGAPPLMSRQIEAGQIEAVSTFWHFAAKLEAADMIRLIGVNEAMAELGIAPAPPLIGFVWNPDQFADRPDAIERFARSVRKAGALLADEDAEWDRLRPLMRAKSDSAFKLLRDYYRAGIVDGWGAADTAAARQLHKQLEGTGGRTFRDSAGPFVADVFPGQNGE